MRPLLCSGPADHSRVVGGVFSLQFQISIPEMKLIMWKTNNNLLCFSNGELEATFNVANPGAGITNICVKNEPLAGLSILQCHNAGAAPDPEDNVVEFYVREDDLVATYQQSPKRANRKQIYLRQAGLYFEEPINGFELVFSMQTQRLDGDPELMIRSEFDCPKIFALANPASPAWQMIESPEDACELLPEDYCGSFAVALAGTNQMYFQVIDPSDFLGARIIRLSDDADRFILSMPVFGNSLEKGVIRRGRASGFFLSGGDEFARATRFYDWYRASAPSLTT